jgi:hypothetical protein
VALNGNDLGQLYDTISPGRCLDITIFVKQNEVDSLRYPDLQIYAYPECEPGLASSIFSSVYFGETTALKDEKQDATLLSVFPNPTSGLLNIQLNGTYMMDEYTLRDMTGKVLRSAKMSDPVQQTELDLHTLSPGIYLLQVRSGQQFIAQKVIIQ